MEEKNTPPKSASSATPAAVKTSLPRLSRARSLSGMLTNSSEEASSNPRRLSLLFSASPRRSSPADSELFKNGEPLFSVYGKKDELVNILYSKTPSREGWYIQNGETQKLIMFSDIDVKSVLSPYAVPVSVSSGCLMDALEKLVYAECVDKISRKQENTLFREDETQACRFMKALLKSDKCCHKFRVAFIEVLYKAIEGKSATQRIKIILPVIEGNLPKFLKASMDFFNKRLMDKTIPPVIVVMLKAIKKILAGLSLNDDACAMHLNTIFFFRFMCPAITVVEELKIISPALSAIISSELKEEASKLLNGIASLEMSMQDPSIVLINEAALLYKIAEKQGEIPKEKIGEIDAKILAIREYIDQTQPQPSVGRSFY